MVALRRFLIFVVVLAVLLVVADRAGEYFAEQAASSTIQNSQHLKNRPDVDIAGFPFLTQFAAGDYDKITVTANDVPVGSDRVRVKISTLTVVLYDLKVSRSFDDFHAATGTATGTISFGELSSLLHTTISYAGHGRIRASKKITVAGQTIDPTITVSPALANGALSFGKAQLNGLGDLGSTVSSVLNDVFDVRVPLQGIPFEVRIRSLDVDSKGLELQLAGSDLSYHT